MVWGFIDLVCIILTITMLVIETIPAYEEHFKDPFAGARYKLVIYGLDVVINLFFTCDLIVKLVHSVDLISFIFGMKLSLFLVRISSARNRCFIW